METSVPYVKTQAFFRGRYSCILLYLVFSGDLWKEMPTISSIVNEIFFLDVFLKQ